MRKFICLALIATSIVALVQSCKKSDSGNASANTGASFDRTGMLTNLSTNIIIPGYTAYKAATFNLDAAVTTFNATPNSANLTALQTAFEAAYKQWQAVSIFDIGPAAQLQLRINTNTFPADVNQINSNITSNTYNPALLANLSAKGLPALDYLLFGTGANNTAILVQYTTDANAANRKTYLAALSAELKTNAANVLTAWQTSYPATFINASGTDAGSSVGQLTNELNEDFEVLKNDEIGIPAGIESMGTIYPQKVQAYYSGISLQLALLHLQAVQNTYMGGVGLGFDDYLIYANAKYNGGSLNDAIKAQFAASTAKLQALSDPLSGQVTGNLTAVTAAYAALQLQTVLLKTDMPSALGILITYGDTDGD
jgi:predicted lipoprotein